MMSSVLDGHILHLADEGPMRVVTQPLCVMVQPVLDGLHFADERQTALMLCNGRAD